ncbi:hypothetical protein CEXT_268791 [Caerostris extrusa]|uniref:Uncharacterized protein n=1 Tax=Caerostris extrusa TaxID=172846 RepID=A0AAV4Q7W0_CAEEX|nr:hypothetical protein CEXT_268791 [Caerostris extrusa]
MERWKVRKKGAAVMGNNILKEKSDGNPRSGQLPSNCFEISKTGINAIMSNKSDVLLKLSYPPRLIGCSVLRIRCFDNLETQMILHQFSNHPEYFVIALASYSKG